MNAFTTRVTHYDFRQEDEEALKRLLADCRKSTGLDVSKTCGLVKEIIRRQTGLSLFNSQLESAWSMLSGHIAELPTGEGKTLAAVVAAIVFALQGKKVHILLFNDYLARRDYMANRGIFSACGLTSGCVEADSTVSDRQAAYACDVVYACAKEVAYDHLRDFLCLHPEEMRLRSFQVAIVDEADSIMIDEARMPLVLAGNTTGSPLQTTRICQAVSALAIDKVEVSRQDQQAWLADDGIEAVQKLLGISNLYDESNREILALIHAALDARFLVDKDVDYIVKNGTIQIIDTSTGRVAHHRRFPDALHQAVEAKERISTQVDTAVYNTTSMQAFLLQYEVLCGMTGTAMTSASDFQRMYGLKVDVVSPNLPLVRVDHEDAVFLRREDQMAALLNCVGTAHAKGQPVLIGTQSVRESEWLSSLLEKYHLDHCVLNARQDEKEAALIAEAGRLGRITVSTNMAGRGVDIKLGGCKEEEAYAVRAAGGLMVLGTALNRCVRIDNQLRGRAGRQGDPGETRFFVSLEGMDLRSFSDFEFYPAGAVVPEGIGRSLRGGIREYPESKYPKLVRRIQKNQEGRDAESRYMLERYGAILEEKRTLVTMYRQALLLEQKEPTMMKRLDVQAHERWIAAYGNHAVEKAEKQLTLHFINRHWASFLSAVEEMRSGVHLEIIGGNNPLEMYSRFVASAFEEMSGEIEQDVVLHMKTCTISESGVDLAETGLSGATTTWTYMINDSADQFSRIPYLMKNMSNTIQGTLFSLQDWWRKISRKE